MTLAGGFDAWAQRRARRGRGRARCLGAVRRTGRPGRGDALRRARRRQAAAPAARARRLRDARRRCRRGDARRCGGGIDPRLFAGPRRHAVHGQRRAAPRQADRARQVRRGAGHARRRRDAGAGFRGAHRRGRHRARAAGAPGAACSRAPPATPAWPAARRSTWPASACRSTRRALRDMHRRKTGALLQASVLMGASLRPARRAGLAGAGRLRRGDRPGVPGRRRHPRRDPGLGDAGQDRRQGHRRQQADLRLGARPRRPRAAMRRTCGCRRMRRWRAAGSPTSARWRRWPTRSWSGTVDVNHPRSAFGAPPRGGDASDRAKPGPRRPLDASGSCGTGGAPRHGRLK